MCDCERKPYSYGTQRTTPGGRPTASHSTDSMPQQRGGGGSSYKGLYYAWGADNCALTRYGMERIDQSPMFNPFGAKGDQRLATPSTGIVPVGAYYHDMARQARKAPKE